MFVVSLRLLIIGSGIVIFIPQAELEPGSLARQMCLNIVDFLNRLATMVGFFTSILFLLKVIPTSKKLRNTVHFKAESA